MNQRDAGMFIVLMHPIHRMRVDLSISWQADRIPPDTLAVEVSGDVDKILVEALVDNPTGPCACPCTVRPDMRYGHVPCRPPLVLVND